MKRAYLLLSLPLLLASCGEASAASSLVGSSSPEAALSSSSSVSNKVVFYQNLDEGDATVLYSLEKNPDGSVAKPATPLCKRYVFSGWYDAKEGGNEYDFASASPDALYAHWDVYDDLSDAEKVSRYVSRIQQMCPKVSETVGHVEQSDQYSTAEGIFYSVDNFVAKRYADLTEIRHYYPKQVSSEDDLTQDQKDAGMTVESVNAANLFLVEQDYFVGNRYYAFYDYNERHASYSTSYEDGKDVSSVNAEKYADAYLSIDFAAYFMGWLNQLGMLLANYPDRFTKNASMSEDFGENSYWIKEVNVSTLDETAVSGAFAFAYTYTVTSSSGYSLTYLYQSTAEFALLEGKIRHCQVQKEMDVYMDGEALQSTISVSLYDFDAVEEYPEFTGTRFAPDDYPTYED